MARRFFAVPMAAILVLAQVATAAAVAAPNGGQASAGNAAPVDKDLLAGLDSGKADRFVVEFTTKADLSGAVKIKEHGKRGKFVLDSLTGHAKKSQAAAISLAKTAKAGATSYWLTNVLVVKGDSKLAKEFAKLAGVKSIRALKVYPLVKPVETKVAILAAAGDPEWGVDKIRAPEAWVDGIFGQGVVVANVDTGVDFSHPALVDHYRGNLGPGGFDHNHNWWDPTGICGDAPCDNAGHGTHTMGTMVGGDGPGPFTPDIGVAPGARWIAAKGCEDFFCTEESLLSSGQFILAPTDLTGANPDPSKRPDIVNNSWGAGPGDPFYQGIVNSWRAAGIIPVFSSGNPGPFCGEGGSPGDFLEVFSAGATDIDDVIADFSGRGPSVYGKINPDISAPGVDVISSVPGGDYASFSGTSMAAPHTAGAIALVLSAEQALIGDPNNYVVATDAIRSTAFDRIDESCGGAEDGDPNNVYGDGRIDAKAAVDLVATGGTLAGTVTDNAGGAPIAGASVTAFGGFRDFTVTTDADGHYEMFLAAGEYDVSAEAFGYNLNVATGVVIVTDGTTTQDFALVAKPRFNINGHVRAAEDGSALEGARVQALGTPVPAAVTDNLGAYTLRLPVGTYTIRASAGGCTETGLAEVELVDADVTLDFNLARKLDLFGHGCRPIALDWVDATTDTALFGDEFAGRLRLPFPFTFYGTEYNQLFISDNGYVNFLAPDQFNPFPVSIPSDDPPNAAIYTLWRDLFLAGNSAISYATVGAPGDRAFVLEFSDIGVRGTTATVDVEIKLHEDGETIDILYGNNPANPGDGRGATIGIENATGTDALEFSFSDSLVGPNSAYRYELMPSGIVHGTVTDENDGQPIAGASVTARPGLGSTRTAADGTYSLRLYPGTYTLSFSATGYVTETSPLTLVDDADVTRDVSLAAPVPTVDPTSVAVELEFGADPTTRSVTLGNDGTAPLTWEAKERSRGSTPPVIGGEAPAGTGAWRQDVKPTLRLPVNGGGTAIAHPKVYRWTAAKPTADLSILVYADDPIHPAPLTYVDQALQRLGLSYTAHYDGDFAGFQSELESGSWDLVIFADDFWGPDFSLFDSLNAYVEGGGRLVLHTWVIEFDPGHPLWERLAFGFVESNFEPPNPVHWWQPDHPAFTFPELAPEPTQLDGGIFGIYGQRGDALDGAESIAGYTTPGPDDGQAALVIANNERTAFKGFLDGQNNADLDSDGVPDGVEIWQNLAFGISSGFFTDVPWLSESPIAGSIAAGGTQPVTLTIGDPGLAPGEHRASVVFVTNSPKPRQVTVDVTLTVALPDSWGGISGTVTDAHTSGPLAGASVILHSQWNGSPFDLTATTAADGTYGLIGPGGTWPLEFVASGYVGATRDELVTAGTTRTGVDAALHRMQPHGVAEGGPFTFVLTEGRSATGTITLSNPGGHEPLTFEIGERPIATATNAGHVSAVTGVNSHRKPAGYVPTRVTPSIVGDPTLVLMDTLPWESDALLQVLDANGIGHDEAGSADMGAINLDLYKVVFIANDQSQAFYNAYLANFDKFDNYVQGGGILWFETAAFGFQDGNLDGVQVPGGLTIHGPQYEDQNVVVAPDHPLMVGVPNPFNGTSASHTTFSDLPAGATVIANAASDGKPTLVEYDHGAGHVIALAQTLEFAWAFDQDGKLILENGVPYAYAFQTLSDVPWLSVSPVEGTVAPDGLQELTVSVNTAGLAPGVYRAIVVIQTNDPDLGNVQVPVVLVVPAYQQGINAGGAAFVAANGDTFAADQGWTADSFGHVGPSSIRSTRSAIAGTDDDALYQDNRVGMTSYRFDVPNGTYVVDLRFAEIDFQKADKRVFHVTLEGSPVLFNFDVFALAGRNAALDRTFTVEVTDGQLDVGFTPVRGDKPMISAIFVTEMPPEP